MALRGGERLKASLAAVAERVTTARQVKVGFIAPATYPDGTPVQNVAAWNEYGTATQPARPFFRTFVQRSRGKWGVELGTILKGTQMDGAKALGQMGLRMQDQLRYWMINGPWTPNAPSTIAKKGEGKAPLFDTKVMLRAIGQEVE
jgi:hypothetical protein